MLFKVKTASPRLQLISLNVLGDQGLSGSNRILMDFLGGADYLGPHRWPPAFNDDVKIKSTNNFRCLAKIKKGV